MNNSLSHIFCHNCPIWQTVNDEEKMVDSCDSGRHPITVCHIKQLRKIIWESVWHYRVFLASTQPIKKFNCGPFEMDQDLMDHV